MPACLTIRHMAQLLQSPVAGIEAHVQEEIKGAVAEGVAILAQEVVGTWLFPFSTSQNTCSCSLV